MHINFTSNLLGKLARGLLFFFLLPSWALSQAVYINCGDTSTPYVGTNYTFEGDNTNAYFSNSGGAYTLPGPASNREIANTNEDELYWTERYGGNLSYDIPVCIGTYIVELYFAEIFFTADNARVFDVAIEGAPALTGYDIHAAVGNKTADIRTFSGIVVTDGNMDIDFNATTNNAKISAIVVRPDYTSQSNYLPTVSPVANLNSESGTSVTVPITACDPDGNGTITLALALPGLTEGTDYTFTDDGNGVGSLLLTPEASKAGMTYTATITATDDQLATDDESFDITVLAPPIIEGLEDLTLFATQTRTFVATVKDANDANLTIDVSPAPPSWLTVTTTQNNTTGQPADYSVEFTASPTQNDATDPLTFTLSAFDGNTTTTGEVVVHVHGAGAGDCLDPIYRINTGGAATGDWSPDTNTDPSPYRVAGGQNTAPNGTASVNTSHVSVPPVATSDMFGKERWDPDGANNQAEMKWEFPVNPNSALDVRLYLSENFGPANQEDFRIFNVAVNGSIPPDFANIDQRALAGANNVGIMLDHSAVSGNDGCNTVLDLEFLRITNKDNPAIKGIEICGPNAAPAALTQNTINQNADSGGAASGDCSLGGTNTSDPDGCAIVYSVATQPNYGSVIMQPDGNFTYSYPGTTEPMDQFTFEACDRLGACVTGTVMINLSAALPVELLRFTATAAGPHARLDWATASETNNRGFQIEKSPDGRQFRAIDFVAGSGNTTERRSYSFLDREFERDSYYRLRQEDFDGAFEFSPVVLLRKPGKDRAGFVIYPNPVGNQLQLRPAGQWEAEEILRVGLYDAQGRRVGTASGDLGGVETRLNGLLASLPPGFYFLDIESGGQHSRLRFSKARY